MEYDHQKIEAYWQQYWKENDTYKVSNQSDKPKYYVLGMFPYPSGEGLHVGHPLSYVATDIFSRYKTLKGFNVLNPQGYDAFGLPAEQYAIETGVHPKITTENNINTYREQLDIIGMSYDWSREVRTSDPNYYKWTQWIFLQLFKSWYNQSTNKADTIENLVETFLKEGNGSVKAATAQTEVFTAEEWQAKSEKEQQEILMNYRLAYQKYADVNWCPELGTVLANDEVKDGVSERGGYPVIKKSMRQWFLRITAYSDRLLENLDGLDWPESVKEMQRNWIGRSEGATIFFDLADHEERVEIFTTRPDTTFGATYMVLAPEHPLVEKITSKDYQKDIQEYIDYVQSRSDLERQSEVKKVTGCFTGAYAINPFTEKKIPIWIGEYVLMGYGTGAIMAVPSDDDRDNAFAEKFRIPIIDVIDKSEYPNAGRQDKLGKLINSGFLDGMEVLDAINAAIAKVEEMGIGTKKVNYRQRDAGYSRQRYWGEPFPIVYNEGIPYPAEESELPLTLPEVESYKPTGTGESPIASAEDWVNLPDGSKRETDTMPGYAGSSWYFLRYMDPDNEDVFAGKEAIDYWKCVDLYIGGSEHSVGHLLYSRMWNMFLYDKGFLPFQEPFKKLVNQGMIQGRSNFVYRLEGTNLFVSYGIVQQVEKEELDHRGFIKLLKEQDLEHYKEVEQLKFTKLHVHVDLVENDILKPEEFKGWRSDFTDAEFLLENGAYICSWDIEKMSKSKYNVANPDEIIEQYGADTFRMYEMFLGPLEQGKPWITAGIDGTAKFIRKLWRLFFENGELVLNDDEPTKDEWKVVHKTIKKVEEDIERLSFNTCVSAFMVCVNELQDLKCHKRAILRDVVAMLSPFAPHVTEELWQNVLKEEGSVTQTTFPVLDESYLVESSFEYPVSINGKVRAKIELPLDLDKQIVEERVLEMDAVQKWVEGKPLKRFIHVPGRIINLVV